MINNYSMRSDHLDQNNIFGFPFNCLRAPRECLTHMHTNTFGLDSHNSSRLDIDIYIYRDNKWHTSIVLE